MNHTLSGRIRWRGNPRGAIRTFLPIPLGPRTYHRELQEPLELSRPASPRRKSEAPFASFQWSSRPNPSGAPERYCPKATRRDDQCNLGCARKNKHVPFTSIICGPIAYRGAPARAEEGQNEFSPNLEFFGGRQDRNHLAPWRCIVDHSQNRRLQCEKSDGGWWQCYRGFVPWPLQGAEFKTGRFDTLQLSFNELRRETCYSKKHD